MDLAAVRDAAKARTAIGCFGSQDLTFTAYVPTTDGLGGVPASKMTPTWLADPWTGVILQPEGTTAQDQDVWFVVRLAPGLGACSITDPTARTCPFGDSLDSTVSVTGHFDDPAAQTCRSKPLKAGGDAGPSKKQMIATCRDQFVVTAVSPA